MTDKTPILTSTLNLLTTLPKTLTQHANNKTSPCVLTAVAVSLIYPALCSALRFRRAKSMHKQVDHDYTTRESLAHMTTADAQRILRELGQYEFPAVMKMSLQFALFRTYGIPTISTLLTATGQFSTPENSSKRFADTGVLIGEFIAHSPDDERSVTAIARMNYLHESFVRSGKITNADLLYTLSVFVTQPIAWVRRFEWRELSDVEVCALGTFWKSIGDAMGIRFEGFLDGAAAGGGSAGSGGGKGWRDGIDFAQDLSQWAHRYEIAHLVPAKSNKITADQLTPMLLFYVPRWLKPVFYQAVGVVMGERLRDAMLYPTPTLESHLLTTSAIYLRKLLLRYLSLPRVFPVKLFTDRNPETGRYNQTDYLVHPFYVRPTFWNRWGPMALFTRLAGGAVPGSGGDKGERFRPEGYLFEEVGPQRKVGKGVEEMKGLKERVVGARGSGCPFA